MGPPPPQILASPLTGPGIPVLTSRISLILAPALPMSEPHWLAGMTRRSVTGALPAAAPSALPAPRSCGGDRGDRGGHTLMWRCIPRHGGDGGHLAGEGGAGGAAHLLQLEGDHGDGSEDGVGGAGDGGDALGAGALRDGDACAALGTVARPVRAFPFPVPPGLSPSHHPVRPRGGNRGARVQGGTGTEQPAAAPYALTCSRILLTVSPFCGERNGAGGQGQEPPGPAEPGAPQLLPCR